MNASDFGSFFLLSDPNPPDDIVKAMKDEPLADRVRWQTGSLIHKLEDGERVGHGILTRDPWNGEKRTHATIICRTLEDVTHAVTEGLHELEREAVDWD